MVERKRIEDALRRSEAYLAEAQRLSHTGSWVWNVSTRDLYWSTEHFQIFGLDPETTTPGYEMFFQMVHPDDRTRVRQIFESAVSKKDAFDCAYRIIRRDGAIAHIHSLAHPVANVPGGVIEYIGAVIDTTERIQAEESVRQAHQQVNMILESISDNFFGLSGDGRFTYFNAHAAKQMQILGKDPARLIGKVAWEELPDMPNKKNVERVLTERVPITDELYYAPLGEWVENHMYPSPDGGLVMFQRYITARKRTEDELRRTQADLAHLSRMTMIGELAASIAHEVNQPLGAIANNSRACLDLLDRSAPHREVRDALLDIVDDADRAASIIARIRALSKNTPPEKTRFAVEEAIGEVVLLAFAALMERHIQVRTEIAEGLPTVSVDRLQLQQVLLNLLTNAIDATSELEEEKRLVTIGAHRGQLEDRAVIVITVQDLGHGFKPEDSERLFEAFYTTKPHGLGMGLRISRSIVEAHGGRLWATSNTGPGASFHCALPAE